MDAGIPIYLDRAFVYLPRLREPVHASRDVESSERQVWFERIAINVGIKFFEFHIEIILGIFEGLPVVGYSIPHRAKHLYIDFLFVAKAKPDTVRRRRFPGLRRLQGRHDPIARTATVPVRRVARGTKLHSTTSKILAGNG
ncbi:hypothetical protein D1610_10430 [Sphingomonas gilva]|uniref:Uncharacterized protein n=1 Tax=Sphingomonas gilva TaxID=2305907 RepID=A0A396RQ04_9SPHN|nr:hypothetical protein D1610_10430 [Sphingomonas gilva]